MKAHANIKECFDNEEKNEAPSLRVHIVRKGDTLRALAIDYLENPSRADEIKKLNSLATDILKVGRELVIPDK